MIIVVLTHLRLRIKMMILKGMGNSILLKVGRELMRKRGSLFLIRIKFKIKKCKVKTVEDDDLLVWKN